MSHELTNTNGKIEMAYAGETPWHGLGEQLERGATIETWLKAAGMEWLAKRARVRYATSRDQESAEYREYPDRVVIFRNDTMAPMGVVSDSFQIVQPRDTLEFFRDLVGKAGMELETAGTLFGGKKFWAMARRSSDDDSAIIDGRDKLKLNLLLATAIDGSMATEGSWIATRVVCNNTLAIGRSEKAMRVKINHRSKFDAVDVKRDLGIETAQSVFDKTIAEMRMLATVKVSPTQVIATTAALLVPEFVELDSEKQAKVLRSKPVEAIGRLTLDGTAIGADLDGVNGTAYGWLNAVTEYVDHVGRSRTDDARLNSAWFGIGAETKERAYAIVGEMARGSHTAVASVDSWIAAHR